MAFFFFLFLVSLSCKYFPHNVACLVIHNVGRVSVISVDFSVPEGDGNCEVAVFRMESCDDDFCPVSTVRFDVGIARRSSAE